MFPAVLKLVAWSCVRQQHETVDGHGIASFAAAARAVRELIRIRHYRIRTGRRLQWIRRNILFNDSAIRRA